MCDGGVAICNRSVGPSWSARPQWPTAAANEAWVWRTALGRPVVPELKTKTASPAGRHRPHRVDLRRDRIIEAEHGHQLGQ
jgi:hypothetical protein